MKKRVTKLLAVACIFALLVGSFAYFTDRVSLTATGTSGNVQIESTSFKGATEDNILVDRDGKDNLNPGDIRDLTFTVTNKGSKAVDLRHVIKLTVTDAKDAALALTPEDGQCEFDIYYAGDVDYTAKAGYVIKNNAKPVFSTDTYTAEGNGAKRVVDGNTITYYFGTTTLLGGANAGVNSERVESADLVVSTDVAGQIDVADSKDAVTYEYVLVYRDTTENRFMNSAIQIDMVVEAKQHYNTNDDWTKVVDETFTVGNLTLDKAAPEHADDDANDGAADANVGINDIAAHEAIVGDADGASVKAYEASKAPQNP